MGFLCSSLHVEMWESKPERHGFLKDFRIMLTCLQLRNVRFVSYEISTWAKDAIPGFEVYLFLNLCLMVKFWGKQWSRFHRLLSRGHSSQPNQLTATFPVSQCSATVCVWSSLVTDILETCCKDVACPLDQCFPTSFKPLHTSHRSNLTALSRLRISPTLSLLELPVDVETSTYHISELGMSWAWAEHASGADLSVLHFCYCTFGSSSVNLSV